MAAMTQRLRVGLVGCGGMGMGHARAFNAHPAYELVAGCDLNPELAQRFGTQFPEARSFTAVARMLAELQPDVVVVATPAAAHAALTIQAAEADVRGIYCEKPMATCLADGIAMVEACARHHTALVVNHQRRTYPVFQTLRQLMQEGAIGDIKLIRASCAGDMLSDGTHLIDTIRFLADDDEVAWVTGQVIRDPVDASEAHGQGFAVSGGWRYGHPVESGCVGIFEFASGLRAEIFTGTLQPGGRRYQDYEVFGTQGRLHRAGDSADPPLLLQDQRGGWRPIALESGGDVRQLHQRATAENLSRFARTIVNGEAHPLSGQSGLKDLELVMAIYEAARLHARLTLPLQQTRYPLELMIEAGQI